MIKLGKPQIKRSTRVINVGAQAKCSSMSLCIQFSFHVGRLTLDPHSLLLRACKWPRDLRKASDLLCRVTAGYWQVIRGEDGKMSLYWEGGLTRWPKKFFSIKQWWLSRSIVINWGRMLLSCHTLNIQKEKFTAIYNIWTKLTVSERLPLCICQRSRGHVSRSLSSSCLA